MFLRGIESFFLFFYFYFIFFSGALNLLCCWYAVFSKPPSVFVMQRRLFKDITAHQMYQQINFIFVSPCIANLC